MIVPHERDKLINAIVYFAAHTKYCGKIKLIKLLYLLDFEHFRQTGRSVTGMGYLAWKMGPVPLDLYQEWEEGFSSDLADSIEIIPEKVKDFTRETVKPKVEFDDRHFTKRELRIMTSLVEQLRDSYSKPMIDLTHAQLGPWEKIWDGGRGNNEPISYELAIADGDPNREAILDSMREYAAIAAAHAH